MNSSHNNKPGSGVDCALHEEGMMDGMCGRYVSPDEATIEREFNLVRTEWRFPANFNIPPSSAVPAIRARGADREGVLLRWGLVTLFGGGKPGKNNTFNARPKTPPSSPSFRGPWKHRQRAIIPALGSSHGTSNAARTNE